MRIHYPIITIIKKLLSLLQGMFPIAIIAVIWSAVVSF